MRNSLWAGLILAVIPCLAGVPPELAAPAQTSRDPAPQATLHATPARSSLSAEQSFQASTTLALVDRHGREVRLTIDEDTEVLVLGTWCVYSRRLDAVLRDRLAAGYLRSKRLVYVFDYDELAHWASQEVERGKVTQEQVDAYVRSRPRGARLVDQDFLSRVAAKDVLFYDEKHPIEHSAVPAAFSEPPNRFDLNYGTWLTRNLGMPPDLKERLYKLHPLQGGS